MSFSQPTCPSCDAPLVLTHTGALDTWVCPAAHGLAMTTSEAYERLQEDEISQIWHKARAAVGSGSASTRKSPTTGRPMVSIEVTYDDDEVAEGEEGDGPDVGSVWIDVDVDEQVIWFDAAELHLFPQDRPDPEPSQDELDAVARIRDQFGQSVVEADHERESHEFAERMYRRIAGHPGLTKVMTEVGSLGRR